MVSPCYCTALRAASRRIAAAYDAALAPVGVNTAQFSLLRMITRVQPVALTELGRLTELDRSTIGRNIRVLERMRLVRLGRGEDQREVTVTLTEDGDKVLADGAPLWEEAQTALENRLGGELANELRTTLRATLNAL